MTPEGRVKAAVKKWLTEHGAWFYMPVSNGMGRHGIPDFICCYQGRFLGIETKAPGKRREATPNQIRELTGIKATGGVALLIDDVEQLERAFHVCKQTTQPIGDAPARPDRGVEDHPSSQAAPAQRRRVYRRSPQNAGVPPTA